jgi:hypothetical protein
LTSLDVPILIAVQWFWGIGASQGIPEKTVAAKNSGGVIGGVRFGVVV